MQQFSQLVLNDREAQSIFPTGIGDKLHSHADSLGAEQVNDEKMMQDRIFAENFEMAIWDKSGKLVESSQLNTPMINQVRLGENATNTAIFIFAKIDIHNVAQGFQNTAPFYSSNAWRLYIKTHPNTGETIVVAQRLKERMADIMGFIGKQMLMLFFSLPLLIVMVVWVVHRGLLPLNSLAHELKERHANDLSPVSECVPSELQSLTYSLNQLLMKVSDGIERQKRFTADASHELKTPITAIKIQASELQHCLQQGLAGDASNDEQRALEALQSVKHIQK